MSARAIRLTSVDIDNALSQAHFEIVYQPITRFADQHELRREAFVRWQHPGLGSLPPATFLSFFESQGRIGELTRYVLHRVISDLAADTQDVPFAASVNLALGDLADGALPADITALLTRHGVDPRRLMLECPTFAPNIPVDLQLASYAALKTTGCPLAVEVRSRLTDGLVALDPFPFDEIKTGGSAILRYARTTRGAPSLTTLAELVAFAQSRGARLVAVGVEDSIAAQALSSIGFDAGQGHALGRAEARAAAAALAETDADAPLDLATAEAAAEADAAIGADEKDEMPSAAPLRRARIAAAKRTALRRLRHSAAAVPTEPPAASGDIPQSVVETARALQARLERNFDEADVLPTAATVQIAEAGIVGPAVTPGVERVDAPAALMAPAKEASLSVSPRLRALIEELTADVEARGTIAPPNFADQLQAENTPPADQLDAIVAKLPEISDATPSAEAPPPTLATDTPLPAAALTASRTQAPAPDLGARILRILRRKYRITHFWPRSWKRALRQYQAAHAARITPAATAESVAS